MMTVALVNETNARVTSVKQSGIVIFREATKFTLLFPNMAAEASSEQEALR